jgi:hypothetical protein
MAVAHTKFKTSWKALKEKIFFWVVKMATTYLDLLVRELVRQKGAEFSGLLLINGRSSQAGL